MPLRTPCAETAEELLPQHASQPGRSASRHGSSSTTLAGRSAGEGEDEQEAGGAAGAAGTAGPAAGTAAGVEEEEGDNRSFYGSEGQVGRRFAGARFLPAGRGCWRPPETYLT